MTIRPEDTLSVPQLERALKCTREMLAAIPERRTRVKNATYQGMGFWAAINWLDDQERVYRIAERRLEELLGESVT